MGSFIIKRNSPTRKALTAHSVFLGVVLASTLAFSKTQVESYATNYPARYMGGEAEIIKAPNGALIYDKALEAVGQIVYTEPTVENLGDGMTKNVFLSIKNRSKTIIYSELHRQGNENVK